VQSLPATPIRGQYWQNDGVTEPSAHRKNSADPYDALLVVSFGGPEQPSDVMPFLENVTRGRRIPRERLGDVAEHYYAFGGRSPINDQCRALVAAISDDFATAGLSLPVYWGNRNWHPLLPDTMAQLADDGIQRAAVFVTSAYSSYSGCRQYREDLAEALAAVGTGAPRLDKLRHYFHHPGFVEPMIDNTIAALAAAGHSESADVRLAFVTHSIPTASAQASGPTGNGYVTQHREVARLVADGVAALTGRRYQWDLALCSRSGSPEIPWLEPDIGDHIDHLAAQGVPAVVMVPIGFVSDHMEVIYDLDTEAVARAESAGIHVARAGTVGTDLRFVAMIRELLMERAHHERGHPVTRSSLGRIAPLHDACPAACCPNPRGAVPAACGL
jgi:protoporphyrin/coproporphyrin ferrochelatase